MYNGDDFGEFVNKGIGKDEFISVLKELYCEYKKEQQQKAEETEQRFYGPILKKLSRFNNDDDEYADAVAVLENYIS